MNRFVLTLLVLFAVMQFLVSCQEQDKISSENLQYVTTKLGGCNLKSDLKSDDSETKENEVVITVSEDFVNVFVGLNYTCKSVPFETKCETIDDVLYMYIIDTCVSEGCYQRCMCYYTFDFVFKYQENLNQKYKIVLIDPRQEDQIVISEGVIDEESCNQDNTLKVGAITEIQLGETAENTQYGLSLRVERINDSRCPIGEWCFWEGNASVQLHLKTKKDEYDFSLDTHNASPFKRDTIIEGIKYRLMDVLPYPVHGEEQPEKTIKILVGDQSMMLDSQWKLIRIQNKETSENSIYPQDNKSYIIHFKKDFTVEFPYHCNVSQGTYIIGNDGNIAFDGFFPCTKMLCGELSYWEEIVINNLLYSNKYTITDDQLAIDGGAFSLFFEKL